MRAGKTEHSLTATEECVLRLVSQANTNREIASTLGISPATVKRHLENILRKLQVRNRAEAAIYGLSMTACDGSNNGDCTLAVWRRWHDNGRNGDPNKRT
jgi:DNA-binding NarL/FixJ family response regulator